MSASCARFLVDTSIGGDQQGLAPPAKLITDMAARQTRIGIRLGIFVVFFLCSSQLLFCVFNECRVSQSHFFVVGGRFLICSGHLFRLHVVSGTIYVAL